MSGKHVSAGGEATRAIRDLAERQHGVVATRQLLALGIGERLIDERARTMRLVRLHRGVHAVGHRRLSRKGEWLAAVLACGPGAALSHMSAAHLWGIRGSRGRIEVVRRSGHRRPHGVWLHQTRSLPAEDLKVEAAIPTTSVERTLVDIAGHLDNRQLERALVEADRAALLDWPRLRRLLDRSFGKKGRGRLSRLVEEVDPRAVEARSPLEVDFLALCRRAGLPLPQVNVLVEAYLVDFLWPTQRVIVETDGFAFHSDPRSFERDHLSTVALAAAGYAVHRATYEMLECDPEPFMRLVADSLRTRA